MPIEHEVLDGESPEDFDWQEGGEELGEFQAIYERKKQELSSYIGLLHA